MPLLCLLLCLSVGLGATRDCCIVLHLMVFAQLSILVRDEAASAG